MSTLVPINGVAALAESSERSWLREIVVGVIVAMISTGLLSMAGLIDGGAGRDRPRSSDRTRQTPPPATKDDRISSVAPPTDAAHQPGKPAAKTPSKSVSPGKSADDKSADGAGPQSTAVLERLRGSWSARYRGSTGHELETVYSFGSDGSWSETLRESATGRVVGSGTGRASPTRDPDRVRLDFTSASGFELGHVSMSSAGDRMTWRIAAHSDARQIGRVLEFVRVRTRRGEE